MHSEKIVRLTHEVPQPFEHVWKTFSQVQSQTTLIISMSHSGYTSSRTNLNKTVTYFRPSTILSIKPYTRHGWKIS